MELVEILLGVSSVFDDFMVHFFHNDSADIVLLFWSQFCFVFFAIEILIEIAINGIWNWHTILISSIQHL